MIDREKVIQGLEHCARTEGVGCSNCPYCKDDDCMEVLSADALALLKEQEEQKRKWLQAIADTQLAVSPKGYETEEGLAKMTGVWNGLQMAWDILMKDT